VNIMKMFPMTLTLSLEPARGSKAGCSSSRASGVSLDALVREALGRIFAEAPGKEPTRSLRGLLAKYSPAPSAEEIGENRAEMFANFPRSAFRFLMVVAIADTHTTLWYLSDPRLQRAASALINATVADGDHIGVSAVSIAETVYLTETGRIPATAFTDVQATVADPKAVLRDVPVDQDVDMNIAAIPREDVPDLPDRIIAATACQVDRRVRNQKRGVRPEPWGSNEQSREVSFPTGETAQPARTCGMLGIQAG
jgi:PIN domain nuclease of toxin-antitoxin system